MTSGNCASCKFWVQRAEGQQGWKIGLGKCTNVPKFFDVTKDGEDASGGYGDEVLKPDWQGVKALALDGSGYCAELLTMPDFGCVSYIPKV